MESENIDTIFKIQMLLDIASDPQNKCMFTTGVEPWSYVYRVKTVKTAKLYLSGLVAQLKSKYDIRSDPTVRWLDDQFEDANITIEEKLFGINLYGDMF